MQSGEAPVMHIFDDVNHIAMYVKDDNVLI